MRFSTRIVAGVVAAGVAAMAVTAVAEPGSGDCGGRPAMVRGGSFDPAAMAEQRLTRLKADLKITPEQEPLWQSFAERAKGEAGKGMQAMRDPAKVANLTAPERMNRLVESMKHRAEAMASVNDAFQQLYAGLTPEQRKLADERAARLGHIGFERTGHHGPRRGPPPADPTQG